MPDNFMERITFFINLFAIAFFVLLLLLGTLYLARLLLQFAARKKASRGGLALIGRRAQVIRTVRGRRPGRVRLEFESRQLEGDAFSDDTIRRGQAVIITGISKGCFRIRPIDGGTLEQEAEGAGKTAGENLPSGERGDA